MFAPVTHKVRDIANKMAMLDREVKYLVNKAKIWRPKESTMTNNTEETGDSKTNSGDSEKKAKTKTDKRESDDSTTIEAEETLELPETDTTQTDSNKDSTDEHLEL